MCVRCKNNLLPSPAVHCVVCGGYLQKYRCTKRCELVGIPQYITFPRKGTIKHLLHDMKFVHVREHSLILVDLLESSSIHLSADTTIVPIPSSAKHVRQRGFDHTKLLAKQLAKRNGCQVEFLLGRRHDYRQVGSNRSQRIAQADTAFYCTKAKSCKGPIIIMDDIVTTGATMNAAVRCLQKAGYGDISILAIAYQPLEE